MDRADYIIAAIERGAEETEVQAHLARARGDIAQAAGLALRFKVITDVLELARAAAQITLTEALEFIAEADDRPLSYGAIQHLCERFGGEFYQSGGGIMIGLFPWIDGLIIVGEESASFYQTGYGTVWERYDRYYEEIPDSDKDWVFSS